MQWWQFNTDRCVVYHAVICIFSRLYLRGRVVPSFNFVRLYVCLYGPRVCHWIDWIELNTSVHLSMCCENWLKRSSNSVYQLLELLVPDIDSNSSLGGSPFPFNHFTLTLLHSAAGCVCLSVCLLVRVAYTCIASKWLNNQRPNCHIIPLFCYRGAIVTRSLGSCYRCVI